MSLICRNMSKYGDRVSRYALENDVDLLTAYVRINELALKVQMERRSSKQGDDKGPDRP